MSQFFIFIFISSGIYGFSCPVLLQSDTSYPIDVIQRQDKHASTLWYDLFAAHEPLSLVVQTDVRQLLKSAASTAMQPAMVTIQKSDTAIFRGEVEVRIRGAFRKEYCSIPNILLDFEKYRSQHPSVHGQIKVVSPCQYGARYQSLLLKELLAYRVFNLFTEKSFRVRLVNLKLVDQPGKRPTLELPSFIIEDIDDLARRNQCRESKETLRHPDQTNRQQMTLISFFQYMIGNTDWGVAHGHNIRFIRLAADSNSRPFAIPYDFDYCGLVNAPYAIPDEQLGIDNVRTRLYMGPPRNSEELSLMKQVFLQRKGQVEQLVMDFPGLSQSERREAWRYLQEFFVEMTSKDFETRHKNGGWGMK